MKRHSPACSSLPGLAQSSSLQIQTLLIPFCNNSAFLLCYQDVFLPSTLPQEGFCPRFLQLLMKEKIQQDPSVSSLTFRNSVFQNFPKFCPPFNTLFANNCHYPIFHLSLDLLDCQTLSEQDGDSNEKGSKTSINPVGKAAKVFQNRSSSKKPLFPPNTSVSCPSFY